MKIILNNEYRLTSDERNIILEKSRITGKDSKTPGDLVWSTVGFFPNLRLAVDAILNKHIQTSEVEGIKNIIAEIKAVGEAITSVIEVVTTDE